MRVLTGLALLALIASIFVIESTAQGITITPALANQIATDCKVTTSAACQRWLSIGKSLCTSDAKNCPTKLDQACKTNVKVCQALAPTFCKALTGSLQTSCNNVAKKYIKNYKP